MKTLTFNKSSWHYTIANFGGFDKWDDQDLCTYTRKFISGIFKSIIIVLCIALFGYGISDAILGIIFSIITGTMLIGESGLFTIYLICCFVFFIGVYLVTGTIMELTSKRSHKSDGFVTNAYKGWKEKYCIKITVQ